MSFASGCVATQLTWRVPDVRPGLFELGHLQLVAPETCLLPISCRESFFPTPSSNVSEDMTHRSTRGTLSAQKQTGRNSCIPVDTAQSTVDTTELSKAH